MQCIIAMETIYAPALRRHTREALLELEAACAEQGANLLEKGYAQDADGNPCLSNEPQAVRWSAYGLYERVLRRRFPTEPIYRYHMHNAVGTVMSHAIGLSAEGLLGYRRDLTGPARANRGLDWLIFEAAACDDVPLIVSTAAQFMDMVPPERVMEPLLGELGAEWTPQDYPEGAQLVEITPERA
jgi:hypothetical protein